jgi:hypothetical protein
MIAFLIYSSKTIDKVQIQTIEYIPLKGSLFLRIADETKNIHI